ncbi:MAG TPA: hypothetical protein VFN85_12325 [Solirubrobacterales bacterium]|nr:hypothetical protein [Solirubrobacterales bacterium]
MFMETPMTEWNDRRLDELNGRMKDGFAEVDKRFDPFLFILVTACFGMVGSLFVAVLGFLLQS